MSKKKNGQHISPHHAWTYLHADAEMSQREHDHILECERCLRLFLLCLKSESFGAALKRLEEHNEADRKSA